MRDYEDYEPRFRKLDPSVRLPSREQIQTIEAYKYAVKTGEWDEYYWRTSHLYSIYKLEASRIRGDYDGIQTPNWVKEVWNKVHSSEYTYTVSLIHDYDITPNYMDSDKGDELATRVIREYKDSGFTVLRTESNNKTVSIHMHNFKTSRNCSIVIKWIPKKKEEEDGTGQGSN